MLHIDIKFCCSSNARLQDPTESSSSFFAQLNQSGVRIDEEERQLLCTNSNPEDWQSTASCDAFREKNQTAKMLEWFCPDVQHANSI